MRAANASFVVIGAVAALVAFVPLPDAITRAVVLGARGWILNGARPGVGHKLVATLAQYALAASFRRHHPLPGDVPDDERIMRRLLALRRGLLNQSEVPHAPAQWPSMVSSLGWCDQLNGAAAVVLAGEFPHVQLVRVVDDSIPGNAHTVGRAWSARRRDWLYFDLWGDRAAVFTVTPDLRVLVERDVGSEQPMNDSANMARLHRLAAVGTPFNEFGATFGGYVLAKLARGAATASPASVSTGPRGPTPPLLPPGVSDDRVALAFLEGRLAQLMGDDRTAAARYAAAARRADAGSAVRRAAEMLAARTAPVR